CESALVSAKEGISVLNFVVDFVVVDFALSKRTSCRKVPWIAVPFDVISATLPTRTCARKSGLYGTRTRDAACVALEAAQKLTTRSPSVRTASHEPIRRRGDRPGARAASPGPP